jgi:4-amino-4-deoxy-L-arabinose transferase-like glycosyltransferase
LLLILIGSALRLILLGHLPPGLNQDEASAGYEAWALLNYGMDRNGVTAPLLFISWGSGQNVLYSYLSMPFIALFGLNEFSVRLLSGLIGCATLPVFYLLARKLRGSLFGLLALLMLALNPWHIMLSRWALESNLLPFFLLLGIWFLVLSRERPQFLPVSAVIFALSLYAYGTAFIFLPTFLIMSIALLVKRKVLKLKPFLLAAVLFLAVAFPITLCNAINMLHLREIKLLGITLPILTQTRQMATTVFSGGGLTSAVRNFWAFLKLLFTQNDGLPWNSVEGFGLFYGVPGLFVAAFGFISMLYDMKKRVSPDPERFILFSFLSALIAAFLIDINVNRINMAFLPIIYFQALGFYSIARILGEKSVYAIIPAMALLCFLFSLRYCTDVREKLSLYFFEGLGDAVQYAETLGKDTVWITTEVNAPYIYVLFYNKIPPGDFQRSVRYVNPDSAFRQVSEFGKYRFGGAKPESNAVLILHKTDAAGYTINAVFGNYAVAALP